MQDTKRIAISGRSVVVAGNDIDTDRIIPARYLRTVVFDGLGEHVFEDDRASLKAVGKVHPFDEPQNQGAEILVVNKNFGCGSSREHAPQAIMRWGIRAIVGENFAEIFLGNCVAIGIPCCCLSHEDIQTLMNVIAATPEAQVKVDLEQRLVSISDKSFNLEMPEGMRQQFITGRWDSTTELLENVEAIKARVASLGYFTKFA
ncbi:MAG: 3-isopropylmalate dehydratase small subunit [Deltaproteobacteria bacterium]|nr:3-isopropylmalate dehydratase small subunit [Deltaproteobacteria bacterium]